MDEKQDKQFKKIFNLLYGENLKLNLFERFDVDKIFEIRILSVDSKFRGQGIAKKLLLKSQEIAEENGFKVRERFDLYRQLNLILEQEILMKFDFRL